MLRPKSLFALAHHSNRKLFIHKNDDLASYSAELRTSEVSKKPTEELLKLLSNLPDESDSERELSFSFLINNESTNILHTENNDAKKENKTDESHKAAIERKEKTRKRRNNRNSIGQSGDGVFLNLFVPTSVKRSQSMRRNSPKTTCFSLTELENRNMDLPGGFGCWSALLVGRPHREIHANTV